MSISKSISVLPNVLVYLFYDPSIYPPSFRRLRFSDKPSYLIHQQAGAMTVPSTARRG